MNKYYSLNWKNEIELASAFYAVEDQVACDLIPQLDLQPHKMHLPVLFRFSNLKNNTYSSYQPPFLNKSGF